MTGVSKLSHITIRIQEEPFLFPNFLVVFNPFLFFVERLEAPADLCAENSLLFVPLFVGNVPVWQLQHLSAPSSLAPPGDESQRWNDWGGNGGTKWQPGGPTSKVLPSFLSTISCLDFGCCRTFFLLLLLLLCHFLCKTKRLTNRTKDPLDAFPTSTNSQQFHVHLPAWLSSAGKWPGSASQLFPPLL